MSTRIKGTRLVRASQLVARAFVQIPTTYECPVYLTARALPCGRVAVVTSLAPDHRLTLPRGARVRVLSRTLKAGAR